MDMKTLAKRIYFILFVFCSIEFAYPQNNEEGRVIPSPPMRGTNDFYVGDRAPLIENPLIKLPIASIKPEGWLKHQLDFMADGFTGHLTEISKWCKFEGSAWVSHDGLGKNGWEEMPYWLKGYIDLGYVTGNKRIIEEANRWVDGIISSQDSTGYFGPRANRNIHDIWPNMVALCAVRTYYDATHDRRVLPFMTNYCRWLMTVPLENYLPGSWQKWRGGDNLDHIYWLYNQTGEKWLLDLALVNHERTADWAGGIPTWHGVNFCQGFREPAEYYQQTKDVRYLKASERNYDSVMNTYGQVPGGMFGADEDARAGFAGPRQGAETCSMVEFMHSDEMLVGITGNPVWADRCEEVAFNSLPAAMTADLKALHYLTAPNQVQLDTANKAPMIENDGNMFAYNPWDFRCCQHNVAFGWPYFAEHLWMATRDNGLAAVFYAANSVTAKVGNGVEVHISESTDYPFDETVNLKLLTPGSVKFPLTLRIPGWCSHARVFVNGKELDIKTTPLSWVVLDRTWKDGDVVRLELPMTILVRTWEKNNNAISVQRGPLTYSLKIGERTERFSGTEQWPAYQVFPTTPWNYALMVDLKNPAASIEIVKRKGSLDAQPFSAETSPLELRVKGKRIPLWKLETNGLIGAFQDSPVKSDESVEKLVLIPMGCARLRVSAFPLIGDGPDAKVWK